MIEIPLDYLHKIADQIIMISSLLAGFSIAIVANLLISESNKKLMKSILLFATSAASFFLISLFSMTNIIMKTTQGYPFEVLNNDLIFPKVVGIVSFLIGIISLLIIISLSGWSQSKTMGRITTTIGILSLILILLMLS